jgi:hypothetical protein
LTNEGLADSVDLLVDLGSVVVTMLTSTGHSHRHTGRMPCSNTGHLAETLVSLTRKLSGSPSLGYT